MVPLDAVVFETDNYFAYVDVGNDRLERRKVVDRFMESAGLRTGESRD